MKYFLALLILSLSVFKAYSAPKAKLADTLDNRNLIYAVNVCMEGGKGIQAHFQEHLTFEDGREISLKAYTAGLLLSFKGKPKKSKQYRQLLKCLEKSNFNHSLERVTGSGKGKKNPRTSCRGKIRN